MIRKKTTKSIQISTKLASTQLKTDIMYQIACLFPVLEDKHVTKSQIPGITPRGINGRKLHDFLHDKEGGRLWSTGEVLVIEFLLNIYDPTEYKSFNFGMAANVWDSGQMSAYLNGVSKYYFGN